MFSFAFTKMHTLTLKHVQYMDDTFMIQLGLTVVFSP